VTIVGVLPAGFYQKTAVWQAKRFPGAMLGLRGSGTPVIARLRPGVTLAQARMALDVVIPTADTSGTTFGARPTPVRVVIASMYDEETSQFGATIQTLSMAVGLILLIACVNVAGLMLARGATRQVELAICAAIGAGRGRLIRQLLVESVLLALIGALVGLLIAFASLDALVALVPLSLPANAPVTINVTVLAFALGLTLVTALLFGLMPALKLSRAAHMINALLAAGGHNGTPLSKRAGQWLIGVEVALALVLMTGAGLMLRSFARLVAVDPGFDTANVFTLEVEPIEKGAALRRDYYASLAEALRRLPEVASVGAIDRLTFLDGGGSYGSVRTDTGASIAGPQRTVLPGYFEAMGVRPLAGRVFEDADRLTGESIVISATASRQYFAGNAVGRALGSGDRYRRHLRIVGVVPDIRHGGPLGRVQPEMYMLPDPHDASVSPPGSSSRRRHTIRARCWWSSSSLARRRVSPPACRRVVPRRLIRSRRCARSDLIAGRHLRGESRSPDAGSGSDGMLESAIPATAA
jgi:predicted permease